MPQQTHTSASAASSWVVRAYAQKNTAPSTAKTDEISGEAIISPVLAVHSIDPDAAPSPSPVISTANPVILMTLGHCHGYPRLPLSPGISIAEGYARWRAFTRFASAEQLTQAAAAACGTWSTDPISNDLTYVEPEHVDDEADAQPLNECCTDSAPCPDHFDNMFEAHRNAQEDRYLEHGSAEGSAA